MMHLSERIKFCSVVLALVCTTMSALAQPTITPPATNHFWFSEEFRSLIYIYGSSPMAACAAASSSLATKSPFQTVDGKTVICGWESDLAPPAAAASCGPRPSVQSIESLVLEEDCTSSDSLFFMARGTPDWTSSVRFKLNSSAGRQAQHLAKLASTVERFYAARGWSMPHDLRYRISQGLLVEIGLNGINAKFSREIGVRPRFNLVLNFGERPPFGLSMEATEGFQPLPN